jgi:formylmethanofuran dehydrogenase subunit D
MPRTNKVEAATIWMDKKIADGMEFPEAHTQACCRFKLNEKQAKQLTENYDAASE